MTLSSFTKNQFLAQIQQTEDQLPLRNEACRSKFYIHPHRTSKVFLFLHGFTAGSYQFEPLGKVFFEAGDNVLIPRQPGHGVAGDWDRSSPPPLPTDIQVYQDWLREWIEIAQDFGDQLIIGGLSSGANLAAWGAIEYAHRVEKALIFAPYFGSQFWVNTLVENLPFYFEWFNKNSQGNFGYKGFRIPALRIFLDLAEELAQRVKTEPSAPILMVSSEADQATRPQPHWEYFESVVQQQPNSWYYRFDKSLQIGHRMMTKIEDNQYQTWLNILAKAYVENDLTWQQIEDVAARMRDDQVWETIVSSFNLQQQVSPDLENILQWSLMHDRLKCLTAPRES